MIVISIGLILIAEAYIILRPGAKQNDVNNGYDTTLSVIRNYRNLSISQSKRYILIFTPPGTITVQYWGVGVPVSPAPVTVATFNLPNDIQFAVQAGFPTPGPDGFGTGTAAITINNCVLVGQDCLIFNPDGSAQDDLGNFNSGVIYLSPPGDLYNSRAVSIYGTTGRVRGWRLINQGGAKWVQQ